MLKVPGLDLELPAVKLPRKSTRAADAWAAGGYFTVRLVASLPALRVHARAGAAASTRPDRAWGGGTLGRWFAIGDVILSREEYKSAHALPAGFSNQDEWTFPPGTELNVGIAGPLFGHPGGAAQAEWLSGPAPGVAAVAGYWSSKSGRA